MMIIDIVVDRYKIYLILSNLVKECKEKLNFLNGSWTIKDFLISENPTIDKKCPCRVTIADTITAEPFDNAVFICSIVPLCGIKTARF